jgi:glycosyltransferase involved in cell wall biosynthesis
MSGYLSEGKQLLVVSDTAIWCVDGQTMAYEPVAREIENFAGLFSDITWLAYLQPGSTIQANARPLITKVTFVLLPKVGGNTLFDKINVLFHVPYFAWITVKMIRRHDVIHSRAPSLPAFVAIIASLFDSKRIYWHKYAGNWIEPRAPLFYRIQRFLMKKATRSIGSINGKWPLQRKHLLSMENPCLTLAELEEGKKKASSKIFSEKLTICFVGNLAPFKGALTLLQAVHMVKDKSVIQKIVIVGDGQQREELEKFAIQSNLPVLFTGYLKRNEIMNIYGSSHIFVLPSKSEGFPKVISESVSFGCVPVVSDVSAINQYIHSWQNGVILETISKECLAQVLDRLVSDRHHLLNMSQEALTMAELFTYTRYVERIKNEILRTKPS